MARSNATSPALAGIARASVAGVRLERRWRVPFGRGILKRHGVVRVFAVDDRQKATLLPLIEAHTAQGCLYYTDDYQAYASLKVRGDHVVVTKEKGRPKGRDHINGIEGFWSYATNWLYVYRGVPKKFFHLYLAETSFRFNHREQDLYPLLHKALRQIDVSKLK